MAERIQHEEASMDVMPNFTPQQKVSSSSSKTSLTYAYTLESCKMAASMASTKGYQIQVVGPLGHALATYDRTQPPHQQRSIDRTFVDAMIVREEVFVVEQGVPLENELDEDDVDCIHLVLYKVGNVPDDNSIPPTSDPMHEDPHGQPAGTIRIVPLQNSLHTDFEIHRTMDGSSYIGEVKSTVYTTQEPFIKLGRLAVIKGQRGHGYAVALVRAALDFAATHPDTMPRHSTASEIPPAPWQGLVLIHAQKQVQKFWQSIGFRLDEGLGIWDEEGMDHVAMWMQLNI